MTDERGVRNRTWAYDDLGRAISSEGAGGLNKYTVSYADDSTSATRTVTNPLGKKATYKFSRYGDTLRLTQVTGEPSQNCVGSTRGWEYDSQGFVSKTVDEEGRATQYAVEARGLPTQIVEAAGTPDARTTSYQWHDAWRLPTQMTRGNLNTVFNYGSDGQLLGVTQKDVSLGDTRSWGFARLVDGSGWPFVRYK
jgi:uncharacterized protein RhaS with RHS repeats